MYVHAQFGGAPQQALLYRGPGAAAGAAPVSAPPEAAQREALAAFVKDVPVAPPAWTSAADRERYARLGHAAFAAEWRVPGTADSAPEVIAGALDEYREAMRRDADGGPGDVIETLRQLAAGRPEIPQLALELALRLQQAGRFEEAAAAARALAGRLPDRPEPLAVLGHILLEQERPGDAQRAFAAALAGPHVTVPMSAALHAAAARAALQRRDVAAARAEAVQAAEAGAGPAIVAFVEGRLLLEQGDANGALARFDEALAASPKAGPPLEELQWRRGDALSQIERLDDAEAAYRRAIDERPRDVGPYVGLATAYHASGRDAQAAAAIDLLLRAVPTAPAYAQAARLSQALGDANRAEALRREARERFPAAAAPR
jgi:tetratricopeptide (TPR) repeat protein